MTLAARCAREEPTHLLQSDASPSLPTARSRTFRHGVASVLGKGTRAKEHLLALIFPAIDRRDIN